jgi:hypothetical protein
MMRLTVLLAATLLLAAPAFADPPAAAPAPAEAHARLFLSPSGEPFRAPPGAPDPFEAWFAQADANHDGAIDRAAFRADAARFFKQLDTNGDGVIDGFEVTAYETKIVPELTAEAEGRYQIAAAEAADHPPGDGGEGGGGHGHGGGRRGGEHGHGGPPAIEQLLDEPEPVSGADFAFDGRVTFDEWMRATDQRFDLLDTAKTGRLTHDQLKALLQKPAAAKR